jgi:hypothetical protein
VNVVRGELEIPFELAGLGVERENGIGVEIVADAFAAIEIGAGIADRPVEKRQACLPVD